MAPTEKRKEVSPEKRVLVVNMHKQGKTTKDIATIIFNCFI